MLQDLQARCAFIQAQVRAGHAPTPAFMEQQCVAVLLVIKSVGTIPIQRAAPITEVILSAGSPWSPDQTTRLLGALGEATTSALTARGRGGPARPQQKCPTVEQFFLQADWDVFGDDMKSPAAKVQAMGHRLSRLGIRCPSEKLLERCIAVLKCMDSTMDAAGAQALQEYCKGLRVCIKAIDGTEAYPYKHLPTYPASPDGLPDEMLAHAYGDDRPPTPPQLPNLEANYNLIGYRSTHLSLRPQPAVGAAGESQLALRASARPQSPVPPNLSDSIVESMMEGFSRLLPMFQTHAGPHISFSGTAGGRAAAPRGGRIEELDEGSGLTVALQAAPTGEHARLPPTPAGTPTQQPSAMPSRSALEPPGAKRARTVPPIDPMQHCEDRLNEIRDKYKSAGRADTARGKRASKAASAAAAPGPKPKKADDDESDADEADKPFKKPASRDALQTPEGKSKSGTSTKSPREKACQLAYNRVMKGQKPTDKLRKQARAAYKKRGEEWDKVH